MGTDKNIKLHIVTDIKIKMSKKEFAKVGVMEPSETEELPLETEECKELDKVGDEGPSEIEEYIKVVKDEEAEVVELPLETDGTLLLSTLQGKCTDAAGLRYRSSSGGWRGIRISGDSLNPPTGGWGCDMVYQVILKKGSASSIDIAETIENQINQQLLQFSQPTHKKPLGSQVNISVNSPSNCKSVQP